MNRSFLHFLLLLIVVTGIIFISNQKKSEPTSKLLLNEVKQIFPNTEKISKENNLYIVKSKDSKNIGKIVDGRKASEAFYGYAGSLPLLIALSPDDKIIKIKLLENNETPAFIEHIKGEGFLEKWNGLSLKKASTTKVDAVTGATRSSSAIIKTITKTINNTLQNNTETATSNISNRIFSEILMIPLIIFALFTFFYKKAGRTTRLALMISTIAISGFLYVETLSLAKFSTFITKIDSISQISPIYLLILFISIILPLITGRNFYCYNLCPFGALQEITSKLKVKKFKLPKTAELFFKTVRIGIIIVTVITAIGYFHFDLTKTEPFAFFAIKSASIYIIVQGTVLIIISLFIPRFWCRYLCPTGFLIRCCQIKRKKD